MRWSDIPRDPPRRTLRQFAGLWMIVFGALAWQWWMRGTPVAAAVLCGAAMLGTVGIVRPGAARPVFVGWMMLVFPVGWLVSRLTLALIFACLITPIALVFRLGRRDLLQLRRTPQTSYWRPKPPPGGIPGYFRQF